jgi:hypothetical protein
VSQSAFLRQLDATLAASLVGAGMGDTATYTPAGGAAVSCTVLVDRTAQDFGANGFPVEGLRTTVTLFLAEVGIPANGGSLVLAATAETFTLDREVHRDESQSRWLVFP